MPACVNHHVYLPLTENTTEQTHSNTDSQESVKEMNEVLNLLLKHCHLIMSEMSSISQHSGQLGPGEVCSPAIIRVLLSSSVS